MKFVFEPSNDRMLRRHKNAYNFRYVKLDLCLRVEQCLQSATAPVGTTNFQKLSPNNSLKTEMYL